MGKLESAYQAELIAKLYRMFPDCFVMKNDEQYRQGTPDLTILYGRTWAVLEVKRDAKAMRRPEPNQEYYVDLLDSMCFAAFICPENEEEVLDALQRSFEAGR